MEQLKLTLSEQEQRTYAELFGMCDIENTGKVTGGKALDLFVSSGLSQDELHKIIDLCGAKRLGHFGRSQFYIALKMIALAQQGIPISNEGLNSVGVELPLPLFGRMYNTNQLANEQSYVFQDRPVPGGMGGIPPPPKHPRGSLQGQRIPGYDSHPIQESPADTLSPQFSPNDSPPLSPGQTQGEPQATKPSAPPVGQYYHDQFDGQPHPPHPQPQQPSLQQPPPQTWAQFDEDNQGLLGGVQHEQRQWANFSDHNKADNSSIDSEAESVDDVWSITEEQHEYYVNQFMTMQPNMSGVIPGHVAKEFFEKSKLHVQELSKIWQLSDVDRDGSLSLDEFCTAMHLVVLRRNDIELPEQLPPALMPYAPLGSTEEPFAADLPPGGTIRRLTPPSPTLPIQTNQWPHSAFAPPPQPQTQSPTSSSLSSPGTKPEPVQFDIKPAISDPDSKIVHPVPMRVSPDGQPLPFTDSRGYEALTDGSPNELVMSPTKSRTPADIVDYGVDQHQPGPPLPMPLQSRPRPTPKKALSIPGPSSEPQTQPVPPSRQALLRPPPGGQQPGDSSIDRPTTLPVASSSEVAPPPPPRSSKTGHSRSSSLDNQLIDFSDEQHHQGGPSQLLPPPALPPRPSPKDASNAAGYSQSGVTLATGDIREIGACAISATDKEIPAMGSSLNLLDSEDDTRDDTDHTPSALSAAQQMVNKTRKEMKSTVRKHRERNNMLLRLNNELNQELQEVMEQRIALEIQLEHLRPFST